MRILQHAFIRVDANVASYPATQIEVILIRDAGTSSYFEHIVGWADVPQKKLFEARVARNRIVAQPQLLDGIGESSFEEVLFAPCYLCTVLHRGRHNFLLCSFSTVTG